MAKKLYAVTATRRHFNPVTRYSNSEQVPTFYLDPNVQGIVTVEHARKIAREVLGDGDIDYDVALVEKGD